MDIWRGGEGGVEGGEGEGEGERRRRGRGRGRGGGGEEEEGREGDLVDRGQRCGNEGWVKVRGRWRWSERRAGLWKEVEGREM